MFSLASFAHFLGLFCSSKMVPFLLLCLGCDEFFMDIMLIVWFWYVWLSHCGCRLCVSFDILCVLLFSVSVCYGVCSVSVCYGVVCVSVCYGVFSASVCLVHHCARCVTISALWCCVLAWAQCKSILCTGIRPGNDRQNSESKCHSVHLVMAYSI